ncbi:MAG: hypothetical protein J6Y37_15665 [Paludibacteraceae bacterium]|nr:hypothetical protein [Paludibacteraceae bacterium]
MSQENELYERYLNEVSTYEKYGSKNVISFEDWLSIKKPNIIIDNTERQHGQHDEVEWLKSIKGNEELVNETELTLYKEVLGHTSQDVDF